MAKRYTKDGLTFYKAGDRVGECYCVSAKWLTNHGYCEYTTKAEDGTDGIVDGVWVHYTGAPYVTPEPVVVEPTEEELAARAEAERVANINSQITSLEAQLAESDYKIIKCTEAQMAGEELPYDIAEIHTERQAIRDQINELQEEL